MSYGVVPSSASEGGVAVATKPGEALPAGVDTWLNLPIMQVPTNATRNNYYLSFDHWFHLDSSEAGAWLEYKTPGGVWNWVATDGGYPSNIDSTDIDVTELQVATFRIHRSHPQWLAIRNSEPNHSFLRP